MGKFIFLTDLTYNVAFKRKQSFKLTKWPNTLKQFVGILPTNCLSVFGHFINLAPKGLIYNANKLTDISTIKFFIPTVYIPFYGTLKNLKSYHYE